MILDRGGTLSKIINRGIHRGASHRGTWTGCYDAETILQSNSVLNNTKKTEKKIEKTKVKREKEKIY